MNAEELLLPREMLDLPLSGHLAASLAVVVVLKQKFQTFDQLDTDLKDALLNQPVLLLVHLREVQLCGSVLFGTFS